MPCYHSQEEFPLSLEYTFYSQWQQTFFKPWLINFNTCLYFYHLRYYLKIECVNFLQTWRLLGNTYIDVYAQWEYWKEAEGWHLMTSKLSSMWSGIKDWRHVNLLEIDLFSVMQFLQFKLFETNLSAWNF